MRHLFLLGTAAVAALAYSGSASAYTISSPSTLSYFDFGTGTATGLQSTAATTVNGVGFTFSSPASATTPTGVYSGSVATTATNNGFTSPFSSAKNYLAVEPGGSITMTYATAQTAFALLWGTIDTYNSLSFTFSGTTGSTVISGADVLAALPSMMAGSTGANVQISGLPSFNTVTATDSTFSAFEFDVATPVPEPVSMTLFAMGLAGLGVIRKRGQSRA